MSRTTRSGSTAQPPKESLRRRQDIRTTTRMQDDDQITHRFKNSDTAMRRAWIDLAVSRVREHLATAPSAGGFAAEQADELAAPAAPRPRLRLVRSGDPA